MAKVIANEVYELLQNGKVNGHYITGSGPNIATAMQAKLILSESTKLNFVGLTMAQYDHRPKETARNSVVFNILARGRSYERSIKITATIKAAGAYAFEIEEPHLTENESIITNIVSFNYLAY